MSEGPGVIEIAALDHFVLTVTDLERTIAFFSEVLGMQAIAFGDGRRALTFGESKINLHQAGLEYLPHAARPVPGSADVCFVTPMSTSEVVQLLETHGVAIEEGPSARSGARGPITSVYIRDPDENLIEIGTYANALQTE